MSEKKPQDHKPKNTKPTVETIDGGWKVTHKGITLIIPDEALDDFELLDDVADVQRDPKAGTLRMPSILRRLAGQAGFDAVMAGFRDETTGRTATSVVLPFIVEVLAAINPNG